MSIDNSLRMKTLLHLENEGQHMAEQVAHTIGRKMILQSDPEHDPKDLQLIEEQLQHMNQYLRILRERHEYWNGKPVV